MTAEREAMTLELADVRDWHLREVDRLNRQQHPFPNDSTVLSALASYHKRMADAIEAHLSRAAEPVGFVLRDATPPYDYYGDSFVLGEPQEDETDELQWAPLYAAPTAGARPIAWTRIEDIKDDEGRAIGTDEPRIVWGAKCPDYEEGWSPLYAGPTHPPEPAIADAVPTSWLDPLLTGPNRIIGDAPYSERDIGELLRAVRARVQAAAMAKESGDAKEGE